MKQRQTLKVNNWYNAYHFQTNRMLNIKYLGDTAEGMRFEDKEKRMYTNRDFYFWKATE
ncbi:MAG: hypothetical protein JW852_00710 [Spirochaetales bacterium]|nr:hypothetical protein [Spirochaetales bacterium]